MIGQPRPLAAPQHARAAHGEAALVDAVQAEPGEHGREGARRRQQQARAAVHAQLVVALQHRHAAVGQAAQGIAQALDRITQPRQFAAMAARRMRKHLVQAQLLHEQRRQAIAPVVEIARDQDGLAVGHHAPDAFGQRQDLAAAAAGEQPQVHHEAMHRTAVELDGRVQQAALLQPVVGDVLVFVVKNGKARQQGVAVVGLVADRVAAVGHVQLERGGQRFVLGVEQRLLLVATLHFLQEDQVGAQAIQAQAQFIQGVAAAQRRAALMDVVADDTDERHGGDGASQDSETANRGPQKGAPASAANPGGVCQITPIP